MNSSYHEFSEVLTLVCVVSRWLASPAQLIVEPHEQVPEGLGAGDDVEGWRQRAALVEVAHPQLSAGELPLDVSVVLRDIKRQRGTEDTPKIQKYTNKIYSYTCFFLK